MGLHTDIEWCDSTCNPSSGCPGCELLGNGCYAEPIHENRLAKTLPDLYAPEFTEVRTIPGRAAAAARWGDLAGKDRPGKPWLGGMPRVIFVGDMGDLFAKDVPFDFLEDDVFRAVRSPQGCRHIWMFLTKQPARASQFAGYLGEKLVHWPSNAWAGTSVTRRENLSRIDHLRCVPAARRFVSFEPLWGDVGEVNLHGIDLAIIGGQSGPGARPFHVDWARSLIRQCREQGTRPFLKQLGSNVVAANDEVAGWFEAVTHLAMGPTERFQGAVGRVRGFRDSKGGDPSEWPEDLRIREFPAGVVA